MTSCEPILYLRVADAEKLDYMVRLSHPTYATDARVVCFVIRHNKNSEKMVQMASDTAILNS